jgi:hypothetical protein
MLAMVKYRLLPDEEEKPVAKFKFVGSEQFKDESVTFYGLSFKRGEVTEVPDEYAANKLRNHFDEAFEEEDGEDAPKKRGRPKKTDEEREAEKAEREADKAQRDAEKARREQEREDAKAEREKGEGEVQTDVGPDEPWDDPEQP